MLSTQCKIASLNVGLANSAKQSTKSRITSGAGYLFVRNGYHGTSMRDVADSVGLRASSLYRHVKSKQELLHRVLDRLMDEALEGARAALAGEESPEQCIGLLVRANICLARPSETALLQSELRNLERRYRDQIVRKQNQYRRLWVSVLQRGVEQGIFRIEDPKLAFFGIIGALNYVENWFNPSGLLSREQVAEVFSRWILRSFGVQR
ncbi:MAG TPA: TetR/AcrR family transcriptional regulator [Candidatus Binataceae bacterium]|nr:TetR/AcrR family transcriptional regulator [Candidatus Binataceae bacterium]